MKRQIAFVAAISAAACAWSVTAPLARCQTPNICLVDLESVFKSHTRFNAQMAALRQEAEQLNQDLAERARQLESIIEQLKGTSPGTAAYTQLESQLAQGNANLEVDRRARTRDLVSREAKLHYDTYVQVSQVIADYCTQHNVRLVFRYDSQPMTGDDPQSIMHRVNSDVVYFAPSKDITATIIARVNAPAAPVAPAGTVPAENKN